jgi:transaldolase
MVSRAENLLKEYKEMGVTQDRILVRIPGTWEGIQAAKVLESKGVQTHVILIYRSAAFLDRCRAVQYRNTWCLSHALSMQKCLCHLM